MLFGERDMTQIDIELTGGDAHTDVASGLFKGAGDPLSPPNLITKEEGKRRNWSKPLDAGSTYTYQIDAQATAGTALTVTVKNHAGTGTPKTFPIYTLTGEAGTVVRYVKNFVFTVAADGGVS
jgi:hypothetical protein